MHIQRIITVGIDCIVTRQIATSYDVKISLVNGVNPHIDRHKEVYAYYKTNPPINRYQPHYVNSLTTTDRVNRGTTIHERVQNGYALEVHASFDHQTMSTVNNIKLL